MTLAEIKKTGRGAILVQVDTDTSKENVSRAAESQGWRVDKIENDGGGYRISIMKD
jgi:TusA-related sulfurtransferase